MNTGGLLNIAEQLLYLLMMLSLPVLAAALLSGVVTGILAAGTRISEPAIGLSARMLSVLAVLLVFLPWMGTEIMDYARDTWQLLLNISF
jgi:type III secretory pathway component EscS